ncbi:L,D-transpeptidase [uncultured Sphingomonas sp.]|uniref:L,D-transpeptidase n=1 Tax=uncultured Sphingomonas sp. TaxID=158754 RepID=UPI0025D06BE4|nr:L,D-transpeptidase [uncultured Sphingomonas sp.]
MKTLPRHILPALTGLSIAAALAPPLPAQTPQGKTIERMAAGESFWAPEIAPEGPVIVIVSLTAQKAFVYRNGIPIGVTTISSGKDGHETPTGVFTILQKEVDHRSNLYSNAPMPFMQRLTWDGIALHAGKLPGHRASHGCIRLPLTFAKQLFGITRLGLTVIVTNNAALPEVAPVGPVLEPLSGDRVRSGSYRWQPDAAASGPVSILVSGRDRRVIVLRDGVQIGSSVVAFERPVEETSAYVLRGIDAAGQHWLRLPLPVQPRPSSAELSAEDMAEASLPQGFRDAVAGVLTPGTTILVTRESIASSGTGARVGLIEADAR